MSKINVITTFSGYDSQCLALDEIKKLHPDFDYELIAWSEIDKYAIQAHNLLYPQWADRNEGDITKINWKKFHGGQEIDLFTYSSPCQDISQAGKQMGLQEGSETRSSLLWNVIDAIKVLRPKYLMQENVKALVSKKFMPDFQKWCERLEGYGYKNYWAVLNAKDFGVPQNRERVFMISVRDDQPFRYEFPKGFPLKTVLADVLEQEVDECYYLSDKSVEQFLYNSAEFKDKHDFSLNPTGVRVSGAIECSSIADEVSSDAMPTNFDEKDENGLPLYVKAPSGNVYNLEYVEEDGVKHPRWTRTVVDEDGKEHKWGIRFRIRKLTPRECFRLMGVKDDRIDQLLATERVPVKKGSTEMVDRLIISKSQLYKCAGNSIVVDVMQYIFENLFYPTYDTDIAAARDKSGQGIIEFEF